MFSLTEKLRFIETVFGQGKLARNSKNFDVRCPICAPKDHTKKKLAIRVEDDANHCWTCSYRGHTLAPLIKKYGSSSQFNEYINKYIPESAKSYASRCVIVNEVEQKLELPKDFKLLPMLSDRDPDVRAVWNYVLSRGLTIPDVWYFKFGVSNDYRWRRRVIMPSFDANGVLNYYVGRAIDEKRKPKYDNPDVDKLPIVFNEINVDWTQRLVICEGPFDLVKCTQNATALLGSDLNEQSALFNKILINNTPIALALDGDMWHTKTPKIAKKLAEYDIDVVVVDVREYGDPGSMTKQQFKEAYTNAKKISWNDSFLNKLDRVSRISMSI